MKAGTCKRVKGNKCLCKNTKGGVAFAKMSRCSSKKRKSTKAKRSGGSMRVGTCRKVSAGRRCICKTRGGKVRFRKSSACK